MHEVVTLSSAEAVKSRLVRAKERMSHVTHPEIWEVGLLAHVTYNLTQVFHLHGGVGRLMYGSRSLAVSDIMKNLTLLSEAKLHGQVVTSTFDLIQAAREIEAACTRLSKN